MRANPTVVKLFCFLALLGSFPAAAADQPLLALAAGSPLNVGGGALAAGDVNGDRCADLIVVAGASLQIYFGSATRPWQPKPDVTNSLPGKASEVAVVDLDGDAKPDLVLADHDSYGVTVLRGSGDGKFQPCPGSPFAAREGTQPHTHGLVVTDLDQDGRLDIVTANNSDGDVSVLLGQPGLIFARARGSPFSCGKSPYPIACADINGDGRADILVPNAVHDSAAVKSLTILLAKSGGELARAPSSPLVPDATVWYVAAGDLNGDRHPDVAATHSEGGSGVTIWLNDGQGKLSPAAGSPLELGHGAWGVEIADMNRDGHGDLVLGADESIRVFLGDARGRFRPAGGSPFKTGKGAWRIVVADFNGDSKLDVATRCVEANRLEVWQAN